MILVLALLIGVLLIIQGLLGIVAPDAFVGVVRFFQTPSMIYVAAALRIAIGIVLFCAVTESRLLIFLRVFGIRGRPLQSYVNGCDASRSRLRKSNRSA
jgi:hypothetical protein